MGWTVLYIAFGIVALWLLGEVLLQYKARLRWRLLAFAGFLGVVLGVLIPSVIVIGLGAAAFAVGQTYVTLSFRRGFASGWAVSRTGIPGVGKRDRGEPDHRDPTLEVSDLQPGDDGHDERDVYQRDSVSSGMPTPVSRTVTMMRSPAGATEVATSIRPPLPVAAIACSAFITMFTKTWCSSSGSLFTRGSLSS